MLSTQPFVLLRHNQERVEAALRTGNYDAVFPCARNHFDEVVAFLEATGVFGLFQGFRFQREREGVPDQLQIRVLLTAVLLRCGSIRQIPSVLFTDAGVLRFLGFNARVLAEGFNRRGGPNKQVPFSRETLYDLWEEERLEPASIDKVGDAYFRSLFAQRLVRGTTYVLDGTSLIARGTRELLMVLLNARGGRELVTGYRIRPEQKSPEERQRAELTLGKQMIRDALQAGAQIRQLIVDRAYIDGAWMRELVELGIDLLVRVKEDMQIFADLEGHGRAKDAAWEEKGVVRKIEGRQVRYRVRLLLVKELESWDSYRGALTGLLVDLTPLEGSKAGETKRMALVTPREYDDAWAMWEHWGKRWRIENSGNRELKEGFLLEKGQWSNHPTAVGLSVLLRVIAYNTFRLYVSAQGQGWVIRGLRELHREVFAKGGMFVVAEAGAYFGIFSVVEFAHLLGKPPRLQGRPPPRGR